jgi:mannose-6-phosphate isomerase-like protein (cupin superfamily)
MQVQQSFTVLSQLVEVFVTSEMSEGTMTVLVQTSKPGEGVPPHSHTREDELFTVLEGSYEVFDGTKWQPLSQGESYFARRLGTHGFRNAGTTTGRLHAVIAPGGLERYLERLGKLSFPEDLEEIRKLGEQFGLSKPD